ncbi:hypothetical protein FE782_18570 [Paenibacillus antri]|uniref:Tissue inhibitor of metalloproteinase n=1 Tax=Paenibacillus antri TaxID=2582848 RepID=A0A5R9G2Y3_9BACL|nr:hypothetical protein [Paenibacillus antri]TLS50707.1 hypothetical protein FE782_18570 [Paenibacillus antri]
MRRFRIGMGLAMLLISLIGLWTFAPPAAKACSCVAPGTPAEHFERADAVFAGTVSEVKQNAQGYITKRVLFEVESTWKGVDETKVVIATGGGGGDCGFDFKEGEQYLVYASNSKMYGDEEQLVSIICDRTASLGAATADLDFLGEGRPPATKVDFEGVSTDSTPRLAVFGVVGIVLAAIFLYFVWNRRKAGK